MTYYCHLDSSGQLGDTNLQLYALKKAADEWNEIVNIVNEVGIDGVNYLKERLTFITNCFGLSLSQLIGQNSPSLDNNKLEPPSKLFPILLKKTNTDVVRKEKLKSEFEDFLIYYDAIRHFGKIKYKYMDELTFAKLDHFRSMTIEIWDIVISMYRQDKENDIEDFSSISKVVEFEKLTNKPIS